MVRCRKQHKGKEKVVRARGKRMHRARTAWCTARTALTSPSVGHPSQYFGAFWGVSQHIVELGAS